MAVYDFYLNFFKNKEKRYEEITIPAALSAEEIIEQLKEKTDTSVQKVQFAFNIKNKIKDLPPFITELKKDNTFTIYRRPYVDNTRNSFQPIFNGRIIEGDNQNSIQGFFDMNILVKTFMLAWLTFVGMAWIITFPMLFELISHLGEGIRFDLLFPAVIPTIMLLFGLNLPVIGRIFGKSDERKILTFLKDISNPEIK